MGPPEGKILTIDTASQNRLNVIKNREIWRKFWKFNYIVLEVTPKGLPIKTLFKILAKKKHLDLKLVL